jgi:hypothetical protein
LSQNEINGILFEVPTGNPVGVPKRHLAVFGVTRDSGKTTFIESAAAAEGNLRVIVFRTKRGELGFETAKKLPLFFEEKGLTHWKAFEGLLSATLEEKVQREPGVRAAIMTLCNDPVRARDLHEILARAEQKLADPKTRGFQRDVYTKIANYMKEVLPQLDRLRDQFTDKLELDAPGIYVMDLIGAGVKSDDLQNLFVASVIRKVYESYRDVIIVVAEIWRFIPQDRGSPVKWIIEKYVREMGVLNSWMWLDSIPAYECLFIRRNGLVETTTMESLFAEADGAIEKTNHGEEIRTFESAVEVLAPTKSRLAWRKISKIIRHPYQGELLRINTIGGLLDVSPNHPIMKYPKYLVEAQSLKLNDRICMRDFEPKRHQSNNRLFIGTADLAWFYGFFAAEGWINGNHVCISNKKMELLEKAKKVIESTFHLSPSYSTPRRGVYTLDVNSQQLAQHLSTLLYLKGATKNKYTKVVPIPILNAPLPVKQAFLDGYIAGDGYIARGDIRVLVSASRTLVLGLTWLLHSIKKGASYSVHIRQDKPRVVQLTVNKGRHTRYFGDEIKKLVTMPYSGFLYDLEVNSKDHTFYLGIGNLRVHNSQDLRGVDKKHLRSFDVRLFGRQPDSHEVEETLKELPLSSSEKPTSKQIMTLKLGHFYAKLGDAVKLVYVRPVWLPEEVAVRVAKGELEPTADEVQLYKPKPVTVTEDESLYKEKFEQAEKEKEDLKKEVDRLERYVESLASEEELTRLKQQIEEEKKSFQKQLESAVQEADLNGYSRGRADAEEEAKQAIQASLKIADQNAEKAKKFDSLKQVLTEIVGNAKPEQPQQAYDMPTSVTVDVQQPTLVINKVTPPLTFDDSTREGKIAIIYAEGKLPQDKWWTTTDVKNAFVSHGWNPDPGINTTLDKFCQWGYFEKKLSGRRPDYRLKLSPDEARAKGLLK